MIVEQNKEQLDVVKLLPETLPSGKKIMWKDLENGLVDISVNKHSARGGNAKPIVIKRFIPINELLFEGLGLRFGDGIKLQGGLPKIFGFSNINIEVHKHFLKFAKECFGLESSQFRVAITMPPTLTDKLEEIENSVSRELNIPRENLFKTRILEKRNHPIVDIKINSTLLALILNQIFDNLQNILFSSKLFCACMLRGIIASEANVHLTKNERRLSEITIAGKEKTKRNFIRELLLKLQIIPDRDKEIEGQECVLVTGLSNFKIFKTWELCKLHPKKENDFQTGIMNFKKEEFRKGECKFLVLKELSKNTKKSTKKLARILNRAPRTINDAVAFLERKNLISRIREGKRIFWEINENGTKFLQVENPIEKLRHNT